MRADMAVDTDNFQMALSGSMTISLKRIGIGNTEFIGFQAGGDIRMGFGIDIGVDAQGNRGDFTQTRGNFLNAVNFGECSPIFEAFHACIQRKFNFCLTLTHTGKNVVFAASPPAAKTRANSPPDTMSNPLPKEAKCLMMLRLPLAFTA